MDNPWFALEIVYKMVYVFIFVSLLQSKLVLRSQLRPLQLTITHTHPSSMGGRNLLSSKSERFSGFVSIAALQIGSQIRSHVLTTFSNWGDNSDNELIVGKTQVRALIHRSY